LILVISFFISSVFVSISISPVFDFSISGSFVFDSSISGSSVSGFFVFGSSISISFSSASYYNSNIFELVFEF